MTREQAENLKKLAKDWANAAYDLALADLSNNIVKFQRLDNEAQKRFTEAVNSLVGKS